MSPISFFALLFDTPIPETGVVVVCISSLSPSRRAYSVLDILAGGAVVAMRESLQESARLRRKNMLDWLLWNIMLLTCGATVNSPWKAKRSVAALAGSAETAATASASTIVRSFMIPS